ncbi:MAG: hypothetical protein J6Z14_06180 [Prevotella sp.]|nr:hypothetical protein [Prevotella sp.]
MTSERQYDADDRETLRVLKMQQADLERLQQTSDAQRQQLSQLEERLADMKRRAKALAQTEGTELPTERHLPVGTQPTPGKRMQLDEVSQWESLVQRANAEVGGVVGVDDLLTANEVKMTEAEVSRIENDFARLTGLNAADQLFLTTATAIQLTRWMMMPRLVGAIGKTARLLALLSPATMALLEHQGGANSNAALTDQVNKAFQEEAEWDEGVTNQASRSWEDILQDGSSLNDKPFSNDALNWLFGIINNITGTRTSGDFSTIDAATGEAVKTAGIFADAFRSIKEDWLRLPAAVYAQFARDRAAAGETSDPLEPLAETFSPEMLSDLYTSQFAQLTAIQELTIVGQQAAVPLVINMAVGLLHGFLYNPAKDGPREFYDARTRKILIYSNALATASNMTIVAASQNWAKLDVGGLIVSGLRIAQDTAYIASLKNKFINQQMDKALEQELRHIDSHFVNLPANPR